MSGSFHFSYFGQSDQKQSCPVCSFSVEKIRILPENDSRFFCFWPKWPKIEKWNEPRNEPDIKFVTNVVY